MKYLFYVTFLFCQIPFTVSSQSLWVHSYGVGVKYKFPSIAGPGLEVGGTYITKNNNVKFRMVYYNYVADGNIITEKILQSPNSLSTYDFVRSEYGFKFGGGYEFNVAKKWRLGFDMSLCLSNVEIISQNLFFPARINTKIVQVPFPAYYAYKDYLGQLDLSFSYLMHKDVAINFKTFFAQSPWNFDLSRNFGVGLGLQFKIFDQKPKNIKDDHRKVL